MSTGAAASAAPACVIGYARVALPPAIALIAEVAAGAPFRYLDADSVLGSAPTEPLLPPADLFRTSRALAEEAADRLVALLPGVFEMPLPGRSLRGPHVAGLTLRLTLKELPGLLAFLATDDIPGAVRVVVDGLLTADQLRRLRARLGSPGGDIMTRTTTPHSFLVDLHAAPQVRPTFRPRLRGAFLRRAAGVAVVGAETDLPYAHGLLEALRRRGGCAVLAKNDRPETTRAMRALAAAGSTSTISREQLGALAWRRRARTRYARTLEELGPAVAALPEEDGVFARPQLGRLLALARQAMALDAFLRHVRPRLVLGALDRSPFGALLSLLAPVSGFATVNVQHGAYLPLHVLDLVPLDLTLAWNAPSAALFHHDGHGAPTRIIGNPHWDELRRETEAARQGTAVASLRDWTGRRRLVVVFPQPSRGFLLSPAVLQRFYACVRDLALARDDVCVLVKQRAREHDDPGVETLQPLLDEDRARIVTAVELPLADALAAADLAVSIYSTALADAVAVGVPAASVDPDDTVRELGLDFTPLVRFCADAGELSAALDAGRSSQSNEQLEGTIIPAFAESYVERLVAALAAEGVLPE